MNLFKQCKISVVEPAGAAAQTALTSDTVDTQGFEECQFIALTGDVTSGSVLTLTIHHSDEASANFAATTCAATFTAGASDADSKALVVSVVKPPKRYLRAVLTRTTQDAVVGGIIAQQFGARELPVSHDATVIASDFEISSASA